MVLSRTRTQTRFVVLPPSKLAVPGIFRNVDVSNRRYDELFIAMQRFRGSVYIEDGAIRAGDLTSDGCHRVAIDKDSWHVLSLDSQGRVVSCLRYLDETHASDFDDLWVRHAALSLCPKFGRKFRNAVEHRMHQA